MCGIAGIVAWDGQYAIDRDLLERMSGRIAHRGPDGKGMYLNQESGGTLERPQVGMVHRRLAILDPEPRADQPFIDEAGRVIVFNGEIYNFRELRGRLDGEGWRTTCDTEVLLRGYARWGEGCAGELDGMCAAGIWDPGQGALYLVRDRMGQKPLYCAGVAGAFFAFASELPALLEIPWIDRSLDERSLVDYLTWGMMPRGTIYRGIGKVPPGHWMMVRRGDEQRVRYFEPNEPHERPGAGAVGRTRELVFEAVRRQLVSDVPLGCFLSGGVDSSIVAAAMCRAGGTVRTFSIGFDDPRYDETPFAAAVAKHLGTEHHEFIVRPDAADDLPKIAGALGEPLGDSSALPTHYLSRETRAQVKVALSGDGGDELFGGYDRYRAMRLGERLRHVPGPLIVAAVAMTRMGPAHAKSWRTRLGRLLGTVGEPAGRRYGGYLAIFDAATVGALLGDGDMRRADESLDVVAARYEALREAGRDVVEAAAAVDREIYLPEDLLVKVDRCSMMHALEVRSPFMDPELVRFAAGLSSEQMLKGGGKRLLREAFAGDLPREVFCRPKRGFAVPIGEWFRGELREMLRETLGARDSFVKAHLREDVVRRLIEEHEAQRADHAQRLYALLMLELWYREGGR